MENPTMKNKKRVLLNARISSHHFALKNVILNLAAGLADDPEFDLYLLISRDTDIPGIRDLHARILTAPIAADQSALNHLYSIFVLPLVLLRHRIDLLVFPQIGIYLFKVCRILFYMHDLIEYHIPNQKKSKLLFRKIAYPFDCRLADHLITVSENSQKDLMEILHVPAGKITVAYDGCDSDLRPIPEGEARDYVAEKYGIRNYLYYMGYITHPQKNLLYLIDEVAEFRKKNPDISLVFAGPQGKEADRILAHANQKLGAHFKYLGKVPWEDLKYLYSGCLTFCFPSLYEGFGMPVLEAMRCRRPVITSNVSSLPEILQDKRCLINPTHSGELCSALAFTISHRDELGEANYQSSLRFSWQDHVKKVLVPLRDILRKVK